MIIDWVSLGIGVGAMIIIFIVFQVASKRKKRDLKHFSELLKGTHDNLIEANEKVRELYRVFKEIENA